MEDNRERKILITKGPTLDEILKVVSLKFGAPNRGDSLKFYTECMACDLSNGVKVRIERFEMAHSETAGFFMEGPVILNPHFNRFSGTYNVLKGTGRFTLRYVTEEQLDLPLEEKRRQ